MNDERLPPVRIPGKMKSQLEQLAKADSRTLSDYVRLVLERHLQSVECLQELASGSTILYVEPPKATRRMLTK